MVEQLAVPHAQAAGRVQCDLLRVCHQDHRHVAFLGESSQDPYDLVCGLAVGRMTMVPAWKVEHPEGYAPVFDIITSDGRRFRFRAEEVAAPR